MTASILRSLTASQLDVRNILTKDGMYRLHASTALYNAFVHQIKGTNEEINVLRAQITAVASELETAKGILDAIDTVLWVASTD